ncbi:MAG: type I methionyl aminopeptidase [Candidatus Omnitrophica bacterium]|nr:type I methionyl aminopeptidase [Candidatus Omnitrophota bacterium]
MIILRNADEIKAIRNAGRITARTLEKLSGSVRPGITTKELDDIAGIEIRSLGGVPAFKGYRGFPANICTSINEVVVHGIPSKRVLEEGDIISIDVGVGCDGYFADAAVTVGVGEIAPDARSLIEVTRASLYEGLAKARAKNRLSDISSAIQQYAESKGFSVVRSFVGHGIGTKIHEDPEIPNFGKSGTGPRLDRGMVLAIEPMINAGTYEVMICEDGWTAVTADGSLSAHFEHTVVITDSDVEILTIL